jgi:tetratricopeptide (TPR) repeat protein
VFEDAEAYSYMGEALMKEKNFEGAIVYFKKAWDISKDDEMILCQGRAIKKIGYKESSDEKFKEAEAIFDSILKSTEYGGRAWLEKGNCNWNLGKNGLAEDYYLKACKIIPKDPKVWINLGDVAISNDSATEALMFYEKSLLYDESSDAYFGKGRAYKSLKQWSLAIEYYDKALKLDEHNEYALFGKAKCYGALKKYRKSIDCYATFIQKFGKSKNIVRAYAHKAWAENRLENYDKALDSCHKAIEIANMKTPASDNIVDAMGKVLLP